MSSSTLKALDHQSESARRRPVRILPDGQTSPQLREELPHRSGADNVRDMHTETRKRPNPSGIAECEGPTV